MERVKGIEPSSQACVRCRFWPDLRWLDRLILIRQLPVPNICKILSNRGLASKARHNSVSLQRTVASRNVVSFGHRSPSGYAPSLRTSLALKLLQIFDTLNCRF